MALRGLAVRKLANMSGTGAAPERLREQVLLLDMELDINIAKRKGLADQVHFLRNLDAWWV